MRTVTGSMRTVIGSMRTVDESMRTADESMRTADESMRTARGGHDGRLKSRPNKASRPFREFLVSLGSSFDALFHLTIALLPDFNLYP